GRESDTKRPRLAGSVAAAVDRVARAGLALREGLHLGRDGDGLAVMRELAPIRAGDPDRDRDERDVLEDALAVLDPDEPTLEVLGFVELRARLVEPLADPLRDGLRRLRSEDGHEVVAADVADEAVAADMLDDGVLDDPGDGLDQPVTADEPLLVVVRLE